MTIKNHSHNCLVLSAAIIALALVLTLCGVGIKPGADFEGALNITYNMNQAFEQEDVEAVLDAQGISGYTIAHSGANGETLQICVPGLADKGRTASLKSALETALTEKYPDMDVEGGTAIYAGSAADASLLGSAALCVLLAILLILLYIAFRLDLSSGLAAAFGLLHDVLIVLSFMALLRSVVQVNATFVAVMLAVVGFSIHSAIIVLGRVRANSKKTAQSGLSREEVVNLSVKESLGLTAIVALIPLSALVVLCILGAGGIREVALPVIIGLVSGMYSANMITGHVWAFLEDRRLTRKKAKRKARKA